VAFNGIFQRLTQLGFVGYVIFYCIKFEPVALIVLADLAIFAPQVAALLDTYCHHL
jgi:hypothetical protein